jgi:hypothetical protein
MSGSRRSCASTEALRGAVVATSVVVAVLALACGAGKAMGQPLSYAEVLADNVVAYEQPDSKSVALRLLFRGEIVVVRERVKAGEREWVRIAMGGERGAFVPASSLSATTFSPPTSNWVPERAVRDERPVAIAALAGGITHGVGVQLRYLPLTRVGIAFCAGTILGSEGDRLQGSVLALGLQGFFTLGPLSPVLELGGSVLMSEAHRSRQRIQALYVKAGLEWMFDSGIFVSALAAYYRSLRIEVLFPHDATTFEREAYGDLDARGRSSVQRLAPEVVVGYAF